jgi:hypothetical protein
MSVPAMRHPGAPAGTPTLSDAEVVGDGTTARSRAARRWRSARFPVILLLVLLGAAILSSLLTARTSAVPFAPDNPREGGARALAEILRDQGVRIEYVRTTAEALTEARAGTTLLVVGTMSLFGDQLTDLRDVAADLVVVGPNSYDVPTLTAGDLDVGGWEDVSSALRTASCDDPDATAAQAITTDEYSVVAATPAATTCFPPEADASTGAYGIAERDGRRVVVITDASLMTNARLAEDGNAALLLRALGRHERLTWYIPSLNETGLDIPRGPAIGDLLPRGALVLGAQLLLVVLALALWRGRRLGRVVTEPLPVTVRSSETTRGRARLYRRSRSLGHAAAALRAGAARRAATRLGLPRSAGAEDVIDALARATGRATEQVAGLLYGPPPTDDAALLDLARHLDDLESEVHRT